MLDLEGFDEVLNNLNEIDNNVEARGMEQLEAAAEVILTRAQQLTPVDTGRLRASGYTKRRGTKVEIGFKAPYSLYVHERTDLHHTNGQAKFLETAMNELAPHIALTFDQGFLDSLISRGILNIEGTDVLMDFASGDGDE